MKKNIIKLVLLFFILILSVSIPTGALALTTEDINMLLNSGIITQAQATSLKNNNIITTLTNISQTNTTNYSNLNCASLTEDLKYTQQDTVSNGNAISILQTFLKKNGYLQTAPTGYFGAQTLSAVKAFQLANNIETTGYVETLTRTKIQDLDCNYTNIVTTSPSVSSIQVTPSKTDSTNPIITLGANPVQVVAGQSTTLKWSSVNVIDKCKITSKDPSGSVFSSTIDSFGSKSTGPIKKTTTYTIVCYNKYGVPGSKSVIIEIVDPTKITTKQTSYTQGAVITSVSPSLANRGSIVTVKGSNFLTANEVIFDGTKVDKNSILSQSSSSISFKIPEYKSCLVSYCAPQAATSTIETGGRKIIQISNINGFSNDFIITLPSKIIIVPGTPIIKAYTPPKLAVTSIKPVSGNRGDTIIISGRGFSSDSIVFFGGFKVSNNLILTKNSTSISFIVPPYQMGCTDPEYEVCPRLPLPGTGLIIETGGNKNIYVMNTLNKSTSTSVYFTLPSKKITY